MTSDRAGPTSAPSLFPAVISSGRGWILLAQMRQDLILQFRAKLLQTTIAVVYERVAHETRWLCHRRDPRCSASERVPLQFVHSHEPTRPESFWPGAASAFMITGAMKDLVRGSRQSANWRAQR